MMCIAGNQKPSVMRPSYDGGRRPVREARERGISFEVTEAGIRVRAPKGALTPELLDRVRAAKPELTRILANTARCWWCHGRIDRTNLPPDVPATVCSRPACRAHEARHAAGVRH